MADGSGGNSVMRVMIIEDNEALAQTTGWLVEMLGYDYRLALSPKQALEDVKGYRPDVIMMDLGLPGMSGYDLCRLLRQESELADTVFIAQTGWGEAEHRRLTAEAGFHHHLVKPLYLEALQDLLGTIEKTLNKAGAEK
ncbi:response regulator [Asticcacaulis biprosthecium]|nr:response regulator [Asticcacaulis biprosthecium]